MGFDIILITYDSAPSLETCVLSLSPFFAGADLAMVAVDNASDDGSADEIARLWPEARVIRNPANVGFAAAVNQAVAACTGAYVVLVNPDVRVLGGTWRDVAHTFEADDRVAAVAGVMLLPDGTVSRSCHASPSVFSMVSETLALHDRFPAWRRARRYRMLDWDMTTAREVEDACGGFLFLRRAALTTVGPFDERFFLYWEETDWMRRAKERGWRVLFTPDIVVEHAGGESTPEASDVLEHHLLESGYKYMGKHGGVCREAEARVVLGVLEALRIGWHALHAYSCDSRKKLAAALHRMPVHLGAGMSKRP